MSPDLLCRSSLWDQDSGRPVSELSLSHSRSMLLWSRSLVRYFFCAVFFSGRADLLEILSEEYSLIRFWMMIIWIMLSVKSILNLMDSVSLSFQHLKICQQILLITGEACVNVMTESCELIALHYTLPQLI